MVGNDIVDLNLAISQSNWQRKGFLEKQFTAREQLEISSSKDPFLKVWTFWSMKEAAYKCHTQKHQQRFFAPHKFECNLTKEDEGVVCFDNQYYCTNTFFNAFYIHSIAEDTFCQNREELHLFSSIGGSKTVGEDLKKLLQEKTGVISAEIDKKKTAVGAPLFYQQNKLLTKSCSISHHGNYGAFVFTLHHGN